MFRRIFHTSVCIAAALVLSSMLAASPALAVTFMVNSIDDLPDTSPGSGTCHTTANTCTLRAAVMQANRSTGAGAEIMLPPGTYHLTIPASVPDGDFNGDLNLIPPPSGSPNATITITGAGAATTIIDGMQQDRVFHVHPGRTAKISGVTIRNGYVFEVHSFGGGIHNEGILTVSDAVIQGNNAAAPTGMRVSGDGGGIFNAGSLSVINSTISLNSADTSGGGIANGAITNIGTSSLTLINSTVSENHAEDGGGIFSNGAASVRGSTISKNIARFGGGIFGTLGSPTTTGLTVINSTITQNSVTDSGGGIYNQGVVANIYNTSIVFNGADSDRNGGSAGGIYNANGAFATTNLRNSIVAGNNVANTPLSDDCTGTLVLFGRNKFTEANPCTLTGGIYTTLNSLALIGPLQDNGGPTLTHALLPGSDAIDDGDLNQGCVDNNSIALTTDQRGQPRVVGGRCDVGAFEYSAAAPPPPPPPPPPPSINYQGLWYHAPAESESGWGINFAHQGDVIFATWFTYDVNGKAWWLTMTANKTTTGVYSGQLIRTNGAPFSAFVAPATPTVVGTGTLTFTSATTGTFAYSVNDGVNVATQSKAIVLQTFGPVPTCVWGAQPDLTKASKYQDLWWAAGGTESGWGINLIHQGTTIFATWFTYDSNRNPLWYSVTATQTATKTYTGTLLRTNGPAFNAVPFNPVLVGRTSVGTATFTFTSGNAGTFAYAVNDGLNSATQTKAIVRQVFRDPGTVCE